VRGPGRGELPGYGPGGFPSGRRITAVEDRMMNRGQMGARVDTQLLGQPEAHPPVHVKCLGPHPAAVEGGHPGRVQVLRERSGLAAGRDLGQQRSVVPQGEFALVPGQQDGFPLLSQRLAPAVTQRPRQPGERGAAAPQRERGSEPVGVREVVAGEPGSGEVSELQGVDRRPRDVQRIAATRADDQSPAQPLAQPQNVVGDHRDRAGRRSFAEQSVDQLFGADGGPGPQRERRQHGGLLRRHRWHRGALTQDGGRAEQDEPEHCVSPRNPGER
jgi:hypothetical protein